MTENKKKHRSDRRDPLMFHKGRMYERNGAYIDSEDFETEVHHKELAREKLEKIMEEFEDL